MKVLYLDCSAGAAGDMLVASLLSLFPNPETYIEKFNSIGLPSVTTSAVRAENSGISGLKFNVYIDGEEEVSVDYAESDHVHVHGHHHDHHHDGAHAHTGDHGHDHEQDLAHDHHHDHNHEHAEPHEHDHHHDHSHRSMADIEAIVNGLTVSTAVKDNVLKVYSLIADAESKAHGKDVTEIHFHEVGTMDAIMDITAFSMLIEEICADRIIASPIRTGHGHVHCAHGVLPVPAPATAYLLRGIPSYAGDILGEMCTPTGAALLKYFVDEFGQQPVMTTAAIGYGAGHKVFPIANMVRSFLGEALSSAPNAESAPTDPISDTLQGESFSKSIGTAGSTSSIQPNGSIIELNCNIDDMTGEEIGFALEEILAAGAADAFTTSIGMKKSRPGTMITVLCKEDARDAVIAAIFKNTTTLGLRESIKARYELSRFISGGSDGPSLKIADGYEVRREKYEYEELASYARENGLSLFEAREVLSKNREED